MSIDSLLKDLVSRIDGASGAIIVGVDGEAIQWSASSHSERLRLRGAYAAVVMQTFRAASARASLDDLRHLVIEYDGASLIAYQIDDDCSVVLELDPHENLGLAVHKLRAAAAKLRDEIVG